MSDLGLGVMLSMSSGNQNLAIISKSLGKTVLVTFMDDDKLHIRFTDGTKIRIEDDGQSCCETRYMTCGDDLEYYKDASFLGVEISDAPSVKSNDDDDDRCHDVQFITAVMAVLQS